jgi:hypothetical protein
MVHSTKVTVQKVFIKTMAIIININKTTKTKRSFTIRCLTVKWHFVILGLCERGSLWLKGRLAFCGILHHHCWDLSMVGMVVTVLKARLIFLWRFWDVAWIRWEYFFEFLHYDYNLSAILLECAQFQCQNSSVGGFSELC